MPATGANLGLLARGQAGLEGALREVETLGGKAIAIPTDVADPDQVEAAAETVEREFGPIDIWINDAMCSVFAPAAEMDAADYKRVTEVTYLGYVYGTLAALKRMVPRDRWHDCAGWLGAGLPRHSFAVCLLRSEARDSRIYRIRAMRIAA